MSRTKEEFLNKIIGENMEHLIFMTKDGNIYMKTTIVSSDNKILTQTVFEVYFGPTDRIFVDTPERAFDVLLERRIQNIG